MQSIVMGTVTPTPFDMPDEEKNTRVQSYLNSAEEAEFKALCKVLGLGKSATVKTALRQLALKYADEIRKIQGEGK